MRLAIIDLGTNTFTLILVEIKQAEYSVIYKKKVAVKLGFELKSLPERYC